MRYLITQSRKCGKKKFFCSTFSNLPFISCHIHSTFYLYKIKMRFIILDSEFQCYKRGLIWNFYLYRVSQEECAILRESVPYVKLYRYNPKHLYPKLNGYGDNGQRSLKLWQLLHTYWLPNTYWNWQEYVVYVMLISVHNIKITCEWHKAIKLNYKNSRTNTRGCL